MRGIPAGTWPGQAGNGGGGGGSGTCTMAAAAPRPRFSVPPLFPRQARGRFRALNVPRRQDEARSVPSRLEAGGRARQPHEATRRDEPEGFCALPAEREQSGAGVSEDAW